MSKAPPPYEDAHARADAAGEDGYIDPATGLFVMTAGYLRRRGACCGNICRHCPYPEALQEIRASIRTGARKKAPARAPVGMRIRGSQRAELEVSYWEALNLLMEEGG